MNSHELKEYAKYLSGTDFWHLHSPKSWDDDRIRVSDGPAGLRVQNKKTDPMGIHGSEPSTCFPSACALASSWDTDLIEEVAQAISEEAHSLGADILLGPGINCKRNPLCGRNFEYYSEDPVVSGLLGAAFIKGLQKNGTGACLKHFAANNQERARFVNNSVVDERALREIYLTAFELAIKKEKPWSVMSSYNALNGQFTGSSGKLLTDILRTEWGFDGVVISDWGASFSRPAEITAGMDLEMPGLGHTSTDKIMEAVRAGDLTEKDIMTSFYRIGLMYGRIKEGRKHGCPKKFHHDTAEKAAAQSAVLLKNDCGILPLKAGSSVAVIGEFAKKPRYQGAGSSHINAVSVDSPLDELKKADIKICYSKGFDTGSEAVSEIMAAEAVRTAAGCDYAVIFAGLPESYESEGFDRRHMRLPEAQLQLINTVTEVNPNTIVVLMCGGPVELPFRKHVKGILLMYLGGEAVGSACSDLLTGKSCPGGKLAESWPETQKSVPSDSFFANDMLNTQYRESIFVGYRYYEKAGVSVAYPFGHGLSYTEFSLSDIHLFDNRFSKGGSLRLCAGITNTGKHTGSEVLQLYIGKKDSAVPRPVKELKAFHKVKLQPGKKSTVTFTLDDRSFSYYSVYRKDWFIEDGIYEIHLGFSSENIIYSTEIEVKGDSREDDEFTRNIAPCYFDMSGGAGSISESEFATLFRGSIPERKQSSLPYTEKSTISDLSQTKIGRLVLRMLDFIAAVVRLFSGKNSAVSIVLQGIKEYPLHAISVSKIFTPAQVDAMISALNLRLIRDFFKKMKKQKQ